MNSLLCQNCIAYGEVKDDRVVKYCENCSNEFDMFEKSNFMLRKKVFELEKKNKIIERTLETHGRKIDELIKLLIE